MTLQIQSFDRLPAVEGWAEVTPPPVKAKTGAPILVTVTRIKEDMMLSISLAAHMVTAFGAASRVVVRANAAEKALMITPCGDDSGFALKGFGKNLSATGTSARYRLRIPAWPNMSAETIAIQANGKVIQWKNAPALVIRLPYGVFPKTGLGRAAP